LVYAAGERGGCNDPPGDQPGDRKMCEGFHFSFLSVT
jgi:hypothetical protein